MVIDQETVVRLNDFALSN